MVGKEQPAVDDEDAAVDFEARAVPPDLPQATEEGDPDRVSQA